MTENVGEGDVEIWRGANAPPAIWEFVITEISDDDESSSADRLDLTGSILILFVGRDEDVPTIVKNTDADANFSIDYTERILTWAPTLDESRLITHGRILRYEIERRIGDIQHPLATGFMIGRGGFNRD